MSISQDSTATTVCREVFDETSPPTNEEVIDYAKRLGIDPESEPHLLHLAREGLTAPLPQGWKPCIVNSPGANSPMYYYYHETTNESQWEHPLDSVYKQLVHEIRGRKRLSFDEDSKTTAKELDSHEEASLPKESGPSTSFSGPTKIPVKLPPLPSKLASKSSERRKETSLDRSELAYSSLTDRVSRDYKNLDFKDPQFYQSPKRLDSTSKLEEVLKRSESMSPRYEKDWEQLSGRFSEGEMIDIDKMSTSSLLKLESQVASERQTQQKGLQLSGGGHVFLKSNRSKDNTPNDDDEARLDEFQSSLAASDKSVEKLKSILRDKGPEDDDKPKDDDERKSVRFDSQLDVFVGSDNESDSESSSENKNFSYQRSTKVVGSRFHVENVSESEHNSQMGKSSSSEFENDYMPDKFVSVKNIDIVSIRRHDEDDLSDIQIDMGMLKHEKEMMLKDMKRHDERRVLEAKNQDARIQMVRDEYGVRLDKLKQQLESSFLEQKCQMKEDAERRLGEDLKREEDKLIAEMEVARSKNLAQLRSDLEVCYEKERQEVLANLKVELDRKRQELLDMRSSELSKLESQFQRDIENERQYKINEVEIVKSHSERLQALKEELETEFEEVKNQLKLRHQQDVAKITDDYEKNLAKILKDFRIDETLSRKVYKQRLEELRTEFSKDLENETKKHNERVTRQDNIDFEKLRCEKRLLEDKYNTLKDKYLKLKKEVRLLVERRNRRKEGNATASETEKSTSVRTRTEKTESTDQKSSPKKSHTNSITNEKSQGTASEQRAGDDFAERAQFPGTENDAAKMSSKYKSDDTTASETQSNEPKKKKSYSKTNRTQEDKHSVENIRKQLEKLEDIGDLLPGNESAYTVRYPFHDKSPANVSSELEFFKHRIHVERDSVRRAREALRQQKSAFQNRQKAWKQRSSKTTLEQLVKEERELSDMEITLHRTRSLLGEKVIHLKHLEQSLERVASAKKHEGETAAASSMVAKNEEVTLSDMSSASSGFSSTDLGTETFVDKPDHYQESTEIIASLENLNSEIREIWGVLNTKQDNTILPPPPALMYPELNWLTTYPQLTTQPNAVPAAVVGTPNIQSNILSQLSAGAGAPATTTHNIISQYGVNSGYTTSVGNVGSASNLMERTRNLRDWIRQARIESSDLISPGQATL